MGFRAGLNKGKIKIIEFFTGFEKRLYLYGLIHADKDSLPNFLCIGAQKSGTTWLYENLRCHPDIFIPDKRDLHYFDHYFYQPIIYYSNYFKGHQNKIKGEVMPGYGLINLDRIRFIKHIIPDLKIFFILRNPIERAWSHAIMTFTKFQGRSMVNVSNIELIEHFQSGLSLQKGNYLKIISNWENVFSKNAMSFIFYEDIKERPEELLNNIFEVLGASSVSDFSQFKPKKVINAGIKVEMPEECLAYLKAMYRDDIFQLHQRFGLSVSRWINEYYV